MTTKRQDRKPSKDFTQITQTGLKAHDLATTHAAELGTRIDPNLLVQLAADLATLGAAIPAAKTAKGGAVAATAGQNTALEGGWQMASAVKLTVQRNSKDPGVCKAWGVGRRMNKGVVKDVIDALQTIVDRANTQPAEAAGFGILPVDVQRYAAQIDAIRTADQAQEKARARAPLTTRARNVLARKILAAVDKIAGAGVVVFDTRPTERAQFEALVRKAG